LCAVVCIHSLTWVICLSDADQGYMLRQLRVFQRMVGAGLIHRAYRPVHYSPSSRSALAEAELEYEDLTSPSVYVAFAVSASADGLSTSVKDMMRRAEVDSVDVVAWTTTPWTLTANMVRSS
jgi:isoleucyl-tRNA synthetase